MQDRQQHIFTNQILAYREASIAKFKSKQPGMLRRIVKRERRVKVSIFGELGYEAPFGLNLYDRDYLVRALKHYRVVQSEKQVRQTANSWQRVLTKAVFKERSRAEEEKKRR